MARRHPRRHAAAGGRVSLCIWLMSTLRRVIRSRATPPSARWRPCSCASSSGVPPGSAPAAWPKTPLRAIQVAALRHPDPFTRKQCLFLLDHYANDQSIEVFNAALEDPVDFVRNLAMHSLACTSCKVEALDSTQVVPGLVRVISSDPRPDLRLRAISMLLHLAPGDGTARTALEAAATSDPDPLTRRAAVGALQGCFVAPRKRYERHIANARPDRSTPSLFQPAATDHSAPLGTTDRRRNRPRRTRTLQVCFAGCGAKRRAGPASGEGCWCADRSRTQATGSWPGEHAVYFDAHTRRRRLGHLCRGLSAGGTPEIERGARTAGLV